MTSEPLKPVASFGCAAESTMPIMVGVLCGFVVTGKAETNES